MMDYLSALLKRFWSVTSIGVLALMLASMPVAFARGGGGGGGGGHGGGGFGGGGGGGFHGGGGGFSGGGFHGGGMPSGGYSGGGFRGGSMPSGGFRGAGPSGGYSRSTPSMPRSNFSPGFNRGTMPGGSTFNRGNAPGTIGRGPGMRTPGGRGPTAVGQPGQMGVGRGPGSVSGIGRGPVTNQAGMGRAPGVAGQPGVSRGPGQTGIGRGPGGMGQGRGQGTMPGGRGQGQFGRGNMGNQARNRVNNFHNRDHGNRNHGNRDHGHGNHNHNDFNDNFFFVGFFPGFGWPLSFGFWGFDDCGAYCTYSPFYYYGYPYVYTPAVTYADPPSYTYSAVPDYATGGYYLDQGDYSGLNAALSDIKNAFIASQPSLLLRHLEPNTQIQIYLDGSYAYSVPGTDYQKMVQDAVAHIKTSSLTWSSVQQRSDGAYTATGTHVFTDPNGNQKTVQVSYSLAQSGGNWVIVSAGSTGS